jgi:peptide/nickel transport system substrate-binding protein
MSQTTSKEGAMGPGYMSDATRRQMIMRSAGVVGGLGAMPALLAACGGGGGGESAGLVESAKGGGKQVEEITWAIQGDIAAFDYAFNYDFTTGVVVPNVIEPLLRFDAKGEVIPNLAESWDQPDELTYVYTLRQGVKFHDGTEMTAEDAAFSLNRILDPKLAAPLAFFTGNVKSAKATGTHELTVKLSKADPIFRYAGAILVGGVASKKAIQADGKKAGTPKAGMIGTGPFKFVSWERGQELVIERFDDYWNKERLPKVKTVRVKILADESTMISSLQTGEIDGTFGLSGKGVKAVQRAKDVQVVEAPSYFIHFLGLNNQRKPWDDPRVRQAVSMAIDKQGALQSVWAGYGQISKSPVTQVNWGYEQDTMKAAYDALPGYERDIAAAKKLIQEAGAEGASAEILVATGWQEQLGLATQAAGKEIGLDFTLKKMPLPSLYAAILNDKEKDYDAFIVDWGADVPDGGATLRNFHSENKVTNESAYVNPEVDKLIDQADAATDLAERAKLLVQVQDIVVTDQSWIVYYSPSVLMPINKRLGGFELSSLWFWQSWAADVSGV